MTSKMTKQEIQDKLVDIDWHPTNPLIAVCESNGSTAILISKLTENWSTYAPKFKELQSNVEYIEREDEFDYKDESDEEEEGKGLPPKKKEKIDAALKDRMEIDIVTLDPNTLSDDDEYDDTPEEKKHFLKHLPIDLKPDVKIEMNYQ